jgi:hypothetical protein
MTDTERARDALNAIDAGLPYAEWIRIGMAAKAAGVALDDFTAWCRGGSNYTNDRAVRVAWDSFSPSGPVTQATLFAAARDSGWSPDKGKQVANGDAYTYQPEPKRTSKPQVQRAPVRRGPDPAAMWPRVSPPMATGI